MQYKKISPGCKIFRQTACRQVKGVTAMDDSTIIKLYWDRNEQAIAATQEKYGSYCAAIARNILGDPEDTAECVNDTYLQAWNAMPPHRPGKLATFLGKITRNLSLDRFRRSHAQKRGGGQAVLALEELGDCVSGVESPEQALDRQELLKAIDSFLSALPLAKRQLFLCRYWHFDSVGDIALRFRMTENAVSVTLNRLRQQLKTNLLERGFSL